MNSTTALPLSLSADGDTMLRDASTRFVAWLFIAAAILLWGGWMLMPVHLGTYFQNENFARIHDVFQWWIWTFRLHLFGMVVTAMAAISLASLLLESRARVMLWPGAATVAAGMIVGAAGAAFYYHHGAWGATEMEGKSAAEISAFVAALLIDTEYVTCLVRFGRVFSGLGLLTLGIGLVISRSLPAWVGWSAAAIGLSAMALTMLLPDQLSLYLPIFHVQSLWLLLTGITIGARGVDLADTNRVA